MKGWQFTLFASAVAILAISAQEENDNISRLKEKVLDAAVDNLNQKTPLNHAFKVQSVEDIKTEATIWETFIQLRFTLKQTTCLKKQFNKENCTTWRKRGSVRKCFACFKFFSPDDYKSFMDCAPPKFVDQVRFLKKKLHLQYFQTPRL
nr:PREDICTED: retinoic acid receptor responder protein 2-like [Latimeria chalumnae]|eukprot:XP_014339467.1 PREDICTED: retinoic acid receptor responder protein 2-like [Latimeria chalumnae]